MPYENDTGMHNIAKSLRYQQTPPQNSSEDIDLLRLYYNYQVYKTGYSIYYPMTILMTTILTRYTLFSI
jgi:hypothetical protein